MKAQNAKIYGFNIADYLTEFVGIYADYIERDSIAFNDYDGELTETQFTLNVPISFCDNDIIQALTVNYYAGYAGGRFYRSRVFFEQPKRNGFHTVTVTIRDGYDV